MPQIQISGGVVLLGSRSILPGQAVALTPAGTALSGTSVVQPLLVDIAGGTVYALNGFRMATILTNAVLTSDGASTLVTPHHQSITIDTVFGATSGSIDISLMGVEPQTGIQTSTILSSGWLSATVQSGVRIASSSGQFPLGYEVAVKWVVSGSIPNVYMTAELNL